MTSLTNHASAQRGETTSAPPDWSRVPFEVPCPRCGVNLHGRTVPRCPHCGLKFDWAAVLPLENLRCRRCEYHLFGLTEPRCPECGEPFAWPETLIAARLRRNEFFEHRWLDAAALLRTWGLAALRPRKLWAGYALSGPPKLGPLLLFALLQWLVFAQGWQVVAMAADPLMNLLGRSLNPPMRFIYNFRPADDFFSRMATWYVTTFVALQVFFQSKRRYGIRWQNTLRVWAHATAFASLLPTIWCLLEVSADASLLVAPRAGRIVQRLYLPLQLGVFVIGLVVTWAHLWMGYRRHFGIRRAWGLAAMAILLGYLLTELVMIFV